MSEKMRQLLGVLLALDRQFLLDQREFKVTNILGLYYASPLTVLLHYQSPVL